MAIPPKVNVVPEHAVPSWMYGLAFLISTILSSGVAAYLSVQSSVDKYIEASKEIQILELKTRETDREKDNKVSAIHTELSELRNKLNSSAERLEDDLKASKQKISDQEIELDGLRKRVLTGPESRPK